MLYDFWLQGKHFLPSTVGVDCPFMLNGQEVVKLAREVRLHPGHEGRFINQFDLGLSELFLQSVTRVRDLNLIAIEAGRRSHEQGMALIKSQGSLRDASNLLFNAVGSDPNNVEYLHDLGTSLLAVNCIQTARLAYSRAHLLELEDFEATLGLACISIAEGQVVEGERIIGEMMQAREGNVVAWGKLAGICELLKLFDRAILAHERAWLLGDRTPQMVLNFGIACYRTGNWMRARELLTFHLLENPENVLSLTILGLSLDHLGEGIESERLIHRARVFNTVIVDEILRAL